jgi:hypothetical protein
MSNAAPIPVLVVDDGELQDIREMLVGLDVPYAEARSTDTTAIPPALSLLVTNARHALDSGALQPRPFIHLVVYDDVSCTPPKALHRSGCDLVLQRPVNAHTFRLLASQALYEGPERRRGRRVVLSAPVELRADGQTRPATLVQLSLRGCGLSTQEAVKIGSEIQLTFPPELTGGDPLQASGSVLSVRELEPGSGRHEVAVAFRLLDVASRRVVNDIMARRRVVNDIMARHGSGAELCPRRAAHPATAPAAGSTEGGASDERPDGARKSFTRRVLAAGSGISHLLIGRDLSSSGMRVRPEPDLELGDEIRLAVYGRPGQPAIMLKAVVFGDEGDDGLVLRFQDVPTSIAARLEQIVAELPTLPGESPAASSAQPGVVVSEILGRR